MLMTARDMQDTLLRYLGGNNNVEAALDIRESINDALKEIWGQHDWPYYQGQKVIQIDAPVSTGTITYVAATRRFTITGGTWPTWAEYGTIRIGVNNAKVAKRLSDTVIEIDPGSALLTDIVSATTYVMYRNEYPLEGDVRKVAYVTIDSYAKIPLQYTAPLEFNHPTTTVTGTPRYFTVQRDRRVQGALSIVFWPMPAIAKTVQFSYIRGPSEVRCWQENTGKITVVSGSTAVTGLNTAFDSTMADMKCLLRIGKNQTEVSTRNGNNPAGEEVVVESVASTTSLVALPAPQISRTAVKYEISSIMDIDEYIMGSAFTQQCYFELSKRRQVADKNIEMLVKTLGLAIKNAKSKASVDRGIEYAGSFVRNSAVVWISVAT